MKRNKKSKRNSTRRRNCQYSGSLGRFEKPYCNNDWNYIDEESASIIGKLEDYEKLCSSEKEPSYYILKTSREPDASYKWYTQRTRDGFDRAGFDRAGYNKAGYNRDGYDKDGYDKDGYNKYGYDRAGFNREGLDRDDYNRAGYNKYGWNRQKVNKETGTTYDKNDYDIKGHKKEQVKEIFFDKDGYRNGWNRQNVNKDTGTKYDIDGYDIDGNNKDGYNRMGYNRFKKNKYGGELGTYNGVLGYYYRDRNYVESWENFLKKEKERESREIK